jgi:hypothetical protein
MPVAVVVAVALVMTRHAVERGTWYLAALTAFDLVTVPFILPVAVGLHWGPRYFLVLAPMLALLVGLLGSASGKLPVGERTMLGAVALIALLLGGWTNSFRASATLLDNYRHRVWPALVEVARLPSRVVVVNHQYCSIELEALLYSKDAKTFVRVEDAGQLERVARAFVARGESPFPFLVFPWQPVPPRFGFGPPGARIACSVRSTPGQFALYDCAPELVQHTAPRPTG